MNLWLVFILAVLIGHLLLDLLIARLNLLALAPELPDEFSDCYDSQRYARSQHYTRIRIRFGMLQGIVTTAVTVIFLLVGGFAAVDRLARSFDFASITTGLIFIGCLLLLSFLLNLPFSLYSTFSIEARFGFNRTTPSTFLADLGKATLLVILLGGPLLTLILWFFENGGDLAWLYCWLGVIGFGFIVQFLAPVLIMPLFNTFTPLPAGSLRQAILEYTTRQRFNSGGIYTMDGSRRSRKVNAFFTGFGRFRKIVFFDTLMDTLEQDEIVAVLAHEMGHYHMRHIWIMMAASILQTGLLFFLLALILENPYLFAAFGVEEVSVYASLAFFAFLYAPVSTLLAVLFNWLSRRHECAADRFAAETTGDPEALIRSLKKLSRENLSNLTPHPLAVTLSHSHPPILQRIAALRKMTAPSS